MNNVSTDLLKEYGSQMSPHPHRCMARRVVTVQDILFQRTGSTIGRRKNAYCGGEEVFATRYTHQQYCTISNEDHKLIFKYRFQRMFIPNTTTEPSSE